MATSKRSGRITANITPERIREAILAGHRVYVEGYDEQYGFNLCGTAQTVNDMRHDRAAVFFVDETPGGDFEGKPVGLFVDQLSKVQIGD